MCSDCAAIAEAIDDNSSGIDDGSISMYTPSMLIIVFAFSLHMIM